MAEGVAAEKTWGKRPFWGVSFDYDPQWLLDEEQKKIQRQLIELCRTTLRHNAVVSDDTYEYPRKNMNALASIGLLALIVPKELGGLGQSHLFAALVTETIARYGCPSTAMVYVMHTGAVACLLFRYHNSPKIQDVLKRMDKDCLIGTLAYSDPATGGHFWYPLSSRARMQDNGCVQLLKHGSWATSAGFADYYVVQTTSPDFKGDYSNLSCFLLFKDEIRANTEEWISLGMHGNQSGPLVCEGMFTKDRYVGPFGDGSLSNDECVDPYFLLLSSACWNGISLGCIDLAKRHVTTKQHADVGLRVADYPTIQDYFGEAVCDTNACRMNTFGVAQAMDKATNNNDWSIHSDLTIAPRSRLLHWGWQLKFSAAKNVTHVSDKMMHACGGTGYKKDLGIERLLRDGKASWVMGPSNEILRQYVGKSTLFGLPSVDFWEQTSNPRALNQELKKLTDDQKVALAEKLMRDVSMNDPKNKRHNHAYQDTEFDNPFNTRPPAVRAPHTSPDEVVHNPALSPDHFVALKLVAVQEMGEKQAEYQFSLPNPTDHTGCLPGQYVQIKVELPGSDGKGCQRYFSPVSGTSEYGKITLVMKFESQGQLSQQFKKLKPGDSVQFKGPCGGFEYAPNTAKHLSLLASGGGATPCIQLVRDIMADPSDQTSVHMIYYADKESEFLYRSELDTYAAKDAKRFDLMYTMKDGLDFDKWQGGDGYIDGEKMESIMPRPNSGESHKILVCGGASMIITVLQYLFEMGYSSEDIFVYGQFGVEQLRSVFGRNSKLSAHRVE